MRNSGGSTDINGYRGKKIEPGQILMDAGRPWPASSTSSLRGADVIDAEFVHVDNHGNTRPAAQSAPPTGFRSIQQESVDFDDDPSAHFRRLGLFSGESLPLNRGRMLPLFGCAVLVVALAVGGFWYTGDQLSPSTPVEPPVPSRSTAADAVANSNFAVESGQSHDATLTENKPVVETNSDGSSIQRSEGSLIYFNSPKSASTAGNGHRSRTPGSRPVRGYRDLTISLAGGSSGR